jgi:hypothetical protein
MKTKFLFIVLLVVAVSFSLPLAGQNDTVPDPGMKGRNPDTGNVEMILPEFVAKPVFEGTNGGTHLKVYIMSVLKGMDDDMNQVGNDDKIKKGTHHIMVDVTDAESGREIPAAVVKVLVVSPSNQSKTVDLESMMNQYGANLTLDEKGEYQFNISVNVNGESNLTPFKYAIK